MRQRPAIKYWGPTYTDLQEARVKANNLHWLYTIAIGLTVIGMISIVVFMAAAMLYATGISAALSALISVLAIGLETPKKRAERELRQIEKEYYKTHHGESFSL